MKRRVLSHELLDPLDILAVNGLLQLTAFLKQIDMSFEL
jgi:hypothetical protein